MAWFIRNAMMLLMLFSLFRINIRDTLTLTVTNDLGGNLTLTVHCKSADDNIGVSKCFLLMLPLDSIFNLAGYSVHNSTAVFSGQTHLNGSIYTITRETHRIAANVGGV
ncbi:hypothetical protein ACE6H2_000262 [Prunus campanulata]